MTALLDWLNGALDGAEKTAQAAASRVRSAGDDGMVWRNGEYGSGVHSDNAAGTSYVAVGAWDHMPDEIGDHIAANDPAHVLRIVAAHRRIVARHQPCGVVGDVCTWCDIKSDPCPCPDLLDVVGIYRDTHPGFDLAWLEAA